MRAGLKLSKLKRNEKVKESHVNVRVDSFLCLQHVVCMQYNLPKIFRE